MDAVAVDPQQLIHVAPDQVAIQPLTTRRSQSTSIVPTPESLAATQQAVEATRAVGPAMAAAEPANADVLEARAVAKEDQSVQERLAAQEVSDFEERAAKRRAVAQANFDAATKSVEGMKLHDFFADKGIANQIAAIVGGAVGGFGSAAFGGPNQAVAILNTRIQQDFDRQKANITNAQHIAELRRRGVVDVENELERELAALEIKQSHAHKAAAAFGEAVALRAGIPAAAAKGDLLVAQQNAEAATLGMKAAQRFERHATFDKTVADTQIRTRAPGAGAAGGKATESQNKLALYGRTIENELKTIGTAAALTPDVLEKYQTNQARAAAADADALKGDLNAAWVGAKRWLGLTPASRYEGINPEAQKILNAVDNAREALARIHSGGAIPTAEDYAFVDQFSPKAGDSPELIRQKLARMGEEGQRILALAGPARALTEGVGVRQPTTEGAAARGQGGTAQPPQGQTRPAATSRPPAAVYNQAIEALRAGSGATPEQRAKAERIRAAFEGSSG